MNKIGTAIASIIGIATVAGAIVAVNFVGNSFASASTASFAFTPGSATVAPLDVFDATFSISTNATADGAGFSGAKITLRFDDGNAGIVDLASAAEGGKLSLVGTNMTIAQDIVRGTDSKGKYLTFTVLTPFDEATLSKTATFSIKFKSLAPGSSRIYLDTAQSEVSGQTGQSDMLFSLPDNAGMDVVSKDPSAPATEITSSASVSPSSARPGDSVTISAKVTSPEARTARISLEVYDSQATKVYQQIYPGEAFTANQSKTFTTSWDTAAANSDTYTVKIGVFSDDWVTLYHWNDVAATVTLNSVVVPLPTVISPTVKAPTVTKIPTSTPKPVATRKPSVTKKPTSTKAPTPTKKPKPTAKPTATKVPTGSTGAGTFVKGIDLNGNSGSLVIDGNTWSSAADTTVSTQGNPFDISWMPYSNTVPDQLKPMLGNGYWGGSITVSKLTPGNYSVFVYIREDDGERNLTMLVQNVIVENNVSSGAPGSWKKLGPYPAQVSANGLLTIASQDGGALIAGIEIRR